MSDGIPVPYKEMTDDEALQAVTNSGWGDVMPYWALVLLAKAQSRQIEELTFRLEKLEAAIGKG